MWRYRSKSHFRETWICDGLERGSSSLFREQKNWTKDLGNDPGKNGPTNAPSSSNHHHHAPSSKFYSKFGLVFSLKTGQCFFLEVSFQCQQKEHRFFWKTILGIFKIALHLGDQQVFMWHSVKILNVFNTLTLTQILWKTKAFLKKVESCFLAKSTKIENVSFPY